MTTKWENIIVREISLVQYKQFCFFFSENFHLFNWKDVIDWLIVANAQWMMLAHAATLLCSWQRLLGCGDIYALWSHMATAGIQACRGIATSVWVALPLQVDFIRYTKVGVSRLELVREDMCLGIKQCLPCWLVAHPMIAPRHTGFRKLSPRKSYISTSFCHFYQQIDMI